MSDTEAPEQMSDRWTLLMVGDEDGLVGEFGHTFPASPEHYDRVDVVRADLYEKKRAAHLEDAVALGRALEEVERLKDRLYGPCICNQTQQCPRHEPNDIAQEGG